MTTSSLKNDNENQDIEEEDIDEEEIDDNALPSLSTVSVRRREFEPFAAELRENAVLFINPHPTDTVIFMDELQRWARVHREHDGGDLSEIYDRSYGGVRRDLPGHPPVDLSMALMFEGAVKKMYRNGDPLLLPEWIDRLNETVEWKW
jgi:hypothetical protein